MIRIEDLALSMLTKTTALFFYKKKTLYLCVSVFQNRPKLFFYYH